MLEPRKILLLILVTIAGCFVCSESALAQIRFRIPQSTLDAAERQLAQEMDPYRRLQLMIRWIGIVEELEREDEAEFGREDFQWILESKRKILDRLEEERNKLLRAGLNLDPLHRELGFRHAELRQHEEGVKYFRLLTEPTPDDFMALGDSLFALEKLEEANEAYLKVFESSKEWRSVAAYKLAWTALRQSRYGRALDFFNRSLQEGDSHLQIKEQAFRDRLIPYLELFEKPVFSAQDAKEWKDLTRRVSPNAEKRADLYQEALKELINGFTAKGKISQAQNAFFFLSQEIEDSLEILLVSAPTWIRVYRAALDHGAVVRILRSLPSRPLDAAKTLTLQAEIFNTAVFYEGFGQQDEEIPEEITEILFLSYQKYFQLYPLDEGVNPLRVNFSQMLFERDMARECLEILGNRSSDDSEEEVRAAAISLEARCELKFLDQLYAETHQAFFYERLAKALLEDKIYHTPNLGASPERVFERLTRMLVGSLQQRTGSRELRGYLIQLIRNFPFPEMEKLFEELQTLSAELRFQDVSRSKALPAARAKAFFQIFQDANPNTEVAKVSLKNSILLTESRDALEHCDAFQNIYTPDFGLGTEIFAHCAALAEHYLDLERELQYWHPLEKELNSDQRVRLGMIEMALGKAEGQKRIEAEASELSKSVLRVWNPPNPPEIQTPREWPRLEQEARSWTQGLRKISFDQISDRVSAQIQGYERLDSRLKDFFDASPEPLYQAKTLYLRAEIADRMSTWISELPEPDGLTEEELIAYREGTEPVRQSWREKREARTRDCSEIAFSLSPDFTQESDFCRESTSLPILRSHLNRWRNRLRPRQALSRPIQILLSQATREEDSNRSKYILTRALQASENDRQRAATYLVFARKIDHPFYWQQSLAHDGGLLEALQWQKEQYKANPFFLRLYEMKIRRLREQN
ncbi:MAG: tetratricopeptide repeat protein [Bradymonadales bacterium]|nr:MAG: tetratricopeptide repeat protein [Bradymonadales bacterium]